MSFAITDELFAQDFIWFHYFNRYKLSYKFSIDSDFGWREYFDSERYRGQFRSGLRYDINSNMYARAGFMYVDGSVASQEIRFYQDYVYSFKLHDITIQQRIRLEQQTFTDPNKNFNFRIRYNPAIKFPSPIGQWTLAAEPFVSVKKDGSYIGANRLIVGVKNKIYGNVHFTLQYINERAYNRVETGYINETQMIRVRIDHVIHPLRTGPLFGRKKSR
ncbi:hypothetical protein NH26_20980 [Flammeovirga pacifica]|uniref:DUF2490 domain-containing protein n=1 Tax=Flammeovirga pacifica TaxID=915059 RepID=A0A1S1YT97_FLAPC|nr:hypothetical protein NH26_20980 [Flammeovirga pacifica]